MSKLILIGLVVAWAVMLVPDFMRFVSRGRRGDTMRSFSSQITSLGSMNRSARQGSVVPDIRPGSMERAVRRPMIPTPSSSMTASRDGAGPARVDPRRRRQDVLVVLGAAALLTLLATVAFGGVFLVIHLLVDLVLIAYLVALAQVLGMIGGTGSHDPAHGPARRTLARHSQGPARSAAKPAHPMPPRPVRAPAAVQPLPVAARQSSR